jgi:hypothetical protein
MGMTPHRRIWFICMLYRRGFIEAPEYLYLFIYLFIFGYWCGAISHESHIFP